MWYNIKDLRPENEQLILVDIKVLNNIKNTKKSIKTALVAGMEIKQSTVYREDEEHNFTVFSPYGKLLTIKDCHVDQGILEVYWQPFPKRNEEEKES